MQPTQSYLRIHLRLQLPATTERKQHNFQSNTVRGISRYPGENEFSAASYTSPKAARNIEADQISARKRIRKLIQQLPADETAEHAADLDKASLKLKTEKSRQRRLRFDWHSLPPDIQNMIFRYAMTTPEIIVPEVREPRRVDVRTWR